MLNKTTLTALGAALIALGQELQGASAEETPGTETPATTTKRRGRPASTGTETPPAEAPKESAAVGKPEDPYSDEKLKEHIASLVQEDGRGAEVKALIAKHGGNKISDLPAANRPAFYRDIEALKM